MSSIMFTSDGKIPILRQPEQPEFFDLINVAENNGEKRDFIPNKQSTNKQPKYSLKNPENIQNDTLASTSIITNEPTNINVTVKWQCCPCPENTCEEQSHNDDCNQDCCDSNKKDTCCICECKDGCKQEPCCEMNWIYKYFCMKSQNTTITEMEEAKAPEPNN